MLGVTCPYCGKTFQYLGDRQTIFCIACGKKLQVSVQVSGVDDPSVSAPASVPDSRSTVYTEPSANYGGYIRTANEVTVQIRLPDMPIPARARFVCFILKWDGKTIGQFECGDIVNVVTDSEIHSLEIEQKNDSLNPMKYWKVFNVDPSLTRTVQLGTEGKQFIIRL